MPQRFYKQGWHFQLIDTKELQTGDLIFLKRRKEPKLIGHIACALDANRIFHCKRDRGALIESLDSVFQDFEQKLKKKQVLYIDPRNKELRALHRGLYIKA